MKTIQKKNAVLTFDEVHTDCNPAQTYEVSLGTQRLGHVSYERQGGNLTVTDLFVLPEFERFGVETQILDALLADEQVHSVSVVVPLSKTSLYGDAGFVCDPSSVLLRKTK